MLYNLISVTVDAAGNLYIADLFNYHSEGGMRRHITTVGKQRMVLAVIVTDWLPITQYSAGPIDASS
ncbi:MAG: hypothetical protein SRB2_00137 [Desulfobacteraceae bacterium Eth-SRB2]|nr:MAG: hypothetical protein SRB2_00137 [Desulfobacteraceae bacterium Eth-SRB2]